MEYGPAMYGRDSFSVTPNDDQQEAIREALAKYEVEPTPELFNTLHDLGVLPL